MKKAAALILTLALMLAFAGCEADPTDNTRDGVIGGYASEDQTHDDGVGTSGGAVGKAEDAIRRAGDEIMDNAERESRDAAGSDGMGAPSAGGPSVGRDAVDNSAKTPNMSKR